MSCVVAGTKCQSQMAWKKELLVAKELHFQTEVGEDKTNLL